jgi:hypothetical protein
MIKSIVGSPRLGEALEATNNTLLHCRHSREALSGRFAIFSQVVKLLTAMLILLVPLARR